MSRWYNYEYDEVEGWIGLEYDEDEDEWFIIEFFDDGDEADRWYRRMNGFTRFE